MKLIIPMAGMGKRLRPITLTTPKPLIEIAGKPIVQWLVEKIAIISEDKITDIAFIIGDFPFDIKNDLLAIGEKLNAKVHIFIQNNPLGTAHAISFASDLLIGPVIVAFADTLFDTNAKFLTDSDVVIWTKKVDNPQQYGVVIKNSNNLISKFVEKPKEFISDEAIIGIYYFKKAELLRSKIDYIIDNKMMENNEYQLTNALQMLLDDGLIFSSHQIDEWLDCGNKDLLINTSKYVVTNYQFDKKNEYINKNSIVIPPVYIGKNVTISNTIVGPNVSIANNSNLSSTIIKNSIVLSNSTIVNANIDNSLIGNNSIIEYTTLNINIGDYNEIKI